MTSVVIPALNSVNTEANYLNSSHGLKSWMLTQGHNRIALLYLIGITFFFAVGGLLAFLLRLELLTPSSI